MSYFFEEKWLILLTKYISFKVGYDDDDTPLYFIEDNEWSRIVFSENDSDVVKMNCAICFFDFLLTTKLFYFLGGNQDADEFIIAEFKEDLHRATSIDDIYDNSSYWWRYYFAPTKMSYEIIERLEIYYDELDEKPIPASFVNEIYARFGREWHLFLDKINELLSS